MTVCIAVAVNDCIVFAADSASTLVSTDLQTGESRILNVYQHGDKVYNLYKRLPICAMTSGMGNIGPASVGTLAKDLRRRMMGGDSDWSIDKFQYTMKDIARKARKFLFEECFRALDPTPPAPHSLEFWIGGYSSDRNAGHEIWKVSIINGDCPDPEPLITQGKTGLFVGGQIGPVSRLVGGFDPALYDALIEGGMDPTSSAQWVRFLDEKLASAMIAPTMPVKDAIDVADFLVDITKRYFRFLPGADIVGGETDIAVVTRYEGFRWIRRKHFYPAALNAPEARDV